MQRVRTKIKRKTRSPQWNEKFILYVVVVVYRTRVRNPTHQPTNQPTNRPVPNPEAVLHLVVWDDQLISNDLLGKVQLPLSGLIDQRSHINWHPLMGKSLSQNYVCTTDDHHHHRVGLLVALTSMRYSAGCSRSKSGRDLCLGALHLPQALERRGASVRDGSRRGEQRLPRVVPNAARQARAALRLADQPVQVAAVGAVAAQGVCHSLRRSFCLLPHYV